MRHLALDPSFRAPASAPVFGPDTPVRDALAGILAAPDQVGAVVDADGAYLGTVTLAGIAAAARASPAGAPLDGVERGAGPAPHVPQSARSSGADPAAGGEAP